MMATRAFMNNKGIYYDWNTRVWRYYGTKEKVCVGGQKDGKSVVLHASRSCH